MSYMQVISPLVLHADPVESDHAVTKRYVDTKKTSINAQSFTSGTISVNIIPSLTGDISSAQGSSEATLSPTAVIAGTHSKITVDNSGRVTSATGLTAADIPNIPFSKITTGKPTTVSGYAITNLITVGGSTVTGPISSTATPLANLDAVTKIQVDSAVSDIPTGLLSVGDVIRKPTDVSPTGFLRCNGAVVDKTVYSGLFDTLGNTETVTKTLGYASRIAIGAGKPWRQQYDINTNTPASFSWTTETSLPIPLTESHSVTIKNKVYLIGGLRTDNWSSDVYVATINSDGTLGSWVKTTSLPGAMTYSSAVVTENRVYLVGGNYNGMTGSQVMTASIEADGTLGTWSSASALPGIMAWTQAFVTKSRLYAIGGYYNNAYSGVSLVTTISSTGTIGTWSTATALPANLAYSQVVCTKNRVFLLGGHNGTSYVANTYSAPINADGTVGAWASGTALPAAVGRAQALVTFGRVYLIGGFSGSHLSTVYMAAINVDGTLGSWVATTALPAGLSESQIIATKSKVYLLGGKNASGITSTVYSANIAGGLTDYTRLHDGTVNKFDTVDVSGTITIQGSGSTTNFTLPDFTSLESDGINYYVKY